MGPRTRHAATGFGRGVRVRLGRGGAQVMSTGSSAARLATRVANDIARRRDAQAAREAEMHALEGVDRSRPSAKDGSKRGSRGARVTKSSHGIKVSMPAKRPRDS